MKAFFLYQYGGTAALLPCAWDFSFQIFSLGYRRWQEICSPACAGERLVSNKNDADQCDHGQNRCETVEHPFTVRYVNFQIMHHMVNTVQTAPHRQDNHQKKEHASNEALRKRQYALIAQRFTRVEAQRQQNADQQSDNR